VLVLGDYDPSRLLVDRLVVPRRVQPAHTHTREALALVEHEGRSLTARRICRFSSDT
jgi:hypothetical protein